MALQLIAKTAAFHAGRRLRAGAEFTFTGDPKAIPKWAAVKGTPEAVLPPKESVADTRPIATQKAVKAKLAAKTEAA
jgi:hypothetical protein